MMKINKLSEQIMDELQGACDYIDLALEYKSTDRELAEFYNTKASQEYQHVLDLHNMVKKEIEKANKMDKKISDETMEVMQKFWDYKHALSMEKADKFKRKQEMYKEL